MKKFVFACYVLVATALLLCFTQCKKEPVCDMVLHVHKTVTGLDTADALHHCFVQVGLEDNYADFAKAEGYTDQNGVFTHTFKYEALLDISAVYDSTYYVYNYDENHEVTDSTLVRDYFVGSGRVKLEPGETVEQYILVTSAQ
ncbi:MAG: hypothetical protein J5642_07325 [Bacteroidales bacterium]|nr:hypothetical protein [Bacteroidales bacterium]